VESVRIELDSRHDGRRNALCVDELLGVINEIAEAHVPKIVFEASSEAMADRFHRVIAYAAQRGLDAQVEIPTSADGGVTITAFGDVRADSSIVGSVRRHRLPALFRRLEDGDRPRERRMPSLDR